TDGEVVVMTAGNPFDPLQVLAADAIAMSEGGQIRFVYALPEDATDDQRRSVGEYLSAIADQCFAPVTTEQVESADALAGLAQRAGPNDLVIVQTEAHNLVYDAVIGSLSAEVTTAVDSTVLLAHTSGPRRHTFIRYLLQRFVY
ncbi:MAG: hypothetical protein ABEH64_06285, partial [Salinirussus sp.]